MNIIKENTEDLTLVVKIEIKEEDYIENYNKSLKAYQRKASVPGFRPGKVPMSYVISSHSRSIKFEELHKISGEAIDRYLTDNKIEYLFRPMVMIEGVDDENWINQKDFVYKYEFVLKPEIDFDIENVEVDYYDIIPPDSHVDSMIKDVLTQKGEVINNDSIFEDSSVSCDLLELNADGSDKEESNIIESNLKLEDIKDNDTKNKLLGLKVDDTIVINPFIAFNDKVKTERFLNINDNEEALKANYKLTIKEIQSVQLAELTTELYNEFFPNDNIQTEEQFREKVIKIAANYYIHDTDQLFYNESLKKFIVENKIDLPENTIKKVVIDFSDNKTSKEEVDKDYPSYRYTIIEIAFEKYLKEKYGFTITDNDIKEYAKSRILSQFGSYQDLDEELLKVVDDYAEKGLKDKKQYSQMRNAVHEIKIIKLLKEKVKLYHKPISFDDFVKMMSTQQHNHDHNHDHDHDHEHDHDHHDHDHDHNHDHHDHDHDHDHHDHDHHNHDHDHHDHHHDHDHHHSH